MNSHDAIRGMLPAMVGGELAEEDRLMLESHLADCAECRGELVQLQSIARGLRSMPEIEPPPWLFSRTMALLRQERAPRRKWFSSLFLPIHLKLPLEAFALVTLCVTAWYLVKDIDRSVEIGQAPPPAQVRQEKLSGQSVAKSADQPVQKQAERRYSGPLALTHENSQPPKSPVIASEQKAGRVDEQYSHPSVSPPKKPDMESPVTPPFPAAAAPGRSAGEAPVAERGMAAKSKIESSKRLYSTSKVRPFSVRLMPYDSDGVSFRLSRISESVGGNIVGNCSESVVVIFVEVSRLPELLEKISSIGRITDRSIDGLPQEGKVELHIMW